MDRVHAPPGSAVRRAHAPRCESLLCAAFAAPGVHVFENDVCPDAPASDVATTRPRNCGSALTSETKPGVSPMTSSPHEPHDSRAACGLCRGTGRPCRSLHARRASASAIRPAHVTRDASEPLAGAPSSQPLGGASETTHSFFASDGVGGLPVRHLKQGGGGKPLASGASAGASHEISACSKVRQCTAYGMGGAKDAARHARCAATPSPDLVCQSAYPLRRWTAEKASSRSSDRT